MTQFAFVKPIDQLSSRSPRHSRLLFNIGLSPAPHLCNPLKGREFSASAAISTPYRSVRKPGEGGKKKDLQGTHASRHCLGGSFG
jgi:hypothetical protein